MNSINRTLVLPVIGFVLCSCVTVGCSPTAPQMYPTPIRGFQPQEVIAMAGTAAQVAPAEEAVAKTLPISLETVFRLTADQNGRVALGREKLNESLANHEIASYRWLPDLTAGTTYARHEGGIQDFNGNLVNSSYGSLFAGVELRGKLDLRDATFKKIDAERQVWQKKGELSQLTAENLLDASTTYIDMLTARIGMTIGNDMDKKLSDVLVLAQKRADVDPGARVEVSRVQAEIHAQRQITRKLEEGARSAAAKLVYLLSLEPGSQLVPIEKRLPDLEHKFLVDTRVPVQELVERAFTSGPGVRELSALLQVIDEARNRASGMDKFMPTFEVGLAEGAFGAGPNASMSFTNRFDLGIGFRWNLTEAVTAQQRLRIADSKIQQAQLGFQELRGKLALGVQEAREACLSNAAMMRMGEQQIKSAEEAFQLSESRLRNNIKGSSPSEVLLSLRSLIGARLTYLNAIREFDKAQLRLFVLVGAGECKRRN